MSVRRTDGNEVLRVCLSADFERGSLTFAGTVPQGVKVRFSSSFGYETIEQAIRDLTAFHASRPGADLVLAFSCMARYWATGVLVGDEISAAYNLWKRSLIGFFSYGQIGSGTEGRCEFHNESLCLVLISPRPSPP